MATWVTPRVWVAGERVSAAKMNEISTDLGILFPHTTAGDLAFRSSASSDLTRLAAGSEGNFLSITSGLPAYAPIVYRWQGGSATDWHAGGTSNFTPSGSVVLQSGNKNFTCNTTGSTSVTFPVTFAYHPHIIVSFEASDGCFAFRVEGITTSGFSVALRDVTTSGSIPVTMHWEAKGYIS